MGLTEILTEKIGILTGRAKLDKRYGLEISPNYHLGITGILNLAFRDYYINRPYACEILVYKQKDLELFEAKFKSSLRWTDRHLNRFHWGKGPTAEAETNWHEKAEKSARYNPFSRILKLKENPNGSESRGYSEDIMFYDVGESLYTTRM